MRARLLITVIVLTSASVASALPYTTGRVTDSANGVVAAGLPVEAWSASGGTYPCPLATQPMGSVRADGYLVDHQDFFPGEPGFIRIETAVPDPLGPSGESGYFASRKPAGEPTGGYNHIVPAMGLVPIPMPTLELRPNGVLVTWTHALDCGAPVDFDRGVDGYAVFRSPSGADSFTEVGRVASTAPLSFLDDAVMGGTWDYALKLVLPTPGCVPQQRLGAHTSRMATIFVVRDADSDGVEDALDNCPIDPNTPQADTDLDGIGDACEPPHPTILLRKRGAILQFSVGLAAVPPGTVYDLHANELPPLAGSAGLFRDTARDILACDVPPTGPSLIDINDGAPRRFYLLAVVLPDGRSDFGNESSGVARPRTTTLPGCR